MGRERGVGITSNTKDVRDKIVQRKGENDHVTCIVNVLCVCGLQTWNIMSIVYKMKACPCDSALTIFESLSFQV